MTNKIVRTRRKAAAGSELIERLNSMIAELIKENRRLKREVVKLAARGSSKASKTIKPSRRVVKRRVPRALAAPKLGRRKAVAAPARKKSVIRRRRKAG